MTISIPFNADSSSVVVRDDEVHFENFLETDPDVVGTIKAAEDPEVEAHRLLRLGAQVQRVARTSSHDELLKSTTDRVTADVQRSASSAVEAIEQAFTRIAHPETGQITHAFAEARTGIEKILSQRLDPDSKASIQCQLEEVMDRAGEKHLKELARVLDSSDEGPLGRLVATLTEGVKAELRELRDHLVAKDASDAATREVGGKLTSKGFVAEDLLHATLEPNATGYGDRAVQTGREFGVLASLAGDEVVTLNPDDTRGMSANIVFECKDRSLSHRETVKELDAALANREASVAVAVFSTQKQAPTTVPFGWFDNKAILVLDKDDPDPHLVRLAYLWARWMVLRALADDGKSIDVARMDSLIETARLAIDRVTQIKRFHSTAIKSINEAGEQAASLKAEVTRALDELRVELRKAE